MGVTTLNNSQFDQEWKELQKLKPSDTQKTIARARLQNTIQSQSNVKKSHHWNWQSVLSTCLLFMIFGGLLWWLLPNEEQPLPHTAEQPETETIGKPFSWNLKDLYAEKTETGWALFKKNKPLQVGSINEVTLSEKNAIISNSAMFVKEELENFPYPTEMYIEHKKMENVAQRYHFFIANSDGAWYHFTLDYSLLEYAEIFQVIASLKLQGIKPYQHNDQLYAKHGYRTLLYPVGIEPISIEPLQERYYWDKATPEAILDYFAKIGEHWRIIGSTTSSHTFMSADNLEEVTISFRGKELSYDFVYHHQEN
jgi:hypothetical protein